MSFSITGKTAIVTGAASGIGLAIARHLADQGANVMCADANEKQLMKSLGDEPEDGNIRTFSGDLRQRLTLANLLSATIDAFEEVDILVNASRQLQVTDALDLVGTELDDGVAIVTNGGQTHDEADGRSARRADRVHHQPQLHRSPPNPARIDGVFHRVGSRPADDPFHGSFPGSAQDQGERDIVRLGDERVLETSRRR